jgi:hypothetical protein
VPTRYRAVQAALDTYHSTYRDPTRNRLQLSGLYALFPNAPEAASFEVIGGWPDYWPNVDSPGVYLIFDANLDLPWVGKASFARTVGSRLSDWFQYENVGSWSRNPAFVATVPVEAAFEAPSLEEYPIGELHPSDNAIGR